MAKYINPFTDVGFKRIFGQELSKPLLLDFLNLQDSGTDLLANTSKGLYYSRNEGRSWVRR